MAVKKVLQATEPRGRAILRRRSKRVRLFDQDLRRLVDDMLETMRANHGVGLAAPQVGVLQRVVVVELPAEKDGEEGEGRPPARFVLCNPAVTRHSEEQEVGEEGCLSLAGLYGDVPRFREVEVRYQDLQGRRKRLQAEGFLARVLQHELDHLEGVLFTDRVEDPTTLRLLTEEGERPIPLEEVLGAGEAGRRALA